MKVPRPQLRWVASCLAVASLAAACASDHSFSLSIVEPLDGSDVTSPFNVKMSTRGVAVEPAGTIKPGSGHHHLLVGLDPVAAGNPIPSSDVHLHLDGGQAEAKLNLAPGTYKLTAQFANGAHLSYGRAMSHTIVVTVR